MLLEIINPSDPYTMRAADFRIACVACNLISAGQTGLRELKDQDDKERHHMPPFLFGGHDEWYFKQFGQTFKEALYETVNNQQDELIACLESVLVCLPEDRDHVEIELAQLSKEAQKIFCEQWHKEHRTSLNDFRKVALDLANTLRINAQRRTPKLENELADLKPENQQKIAEVPL